MKELVNVVAQHEDEDQAEDTLSLCDLSMYSDDSSDFSCTESSKESHDGTFDDAFEFFTAQSRLKIDDIIFCGRSIPCRGTPTYQARQSRMSLFFSRIRRSSSSKPTIHEGLSDGLEKSKASKAKWSMLMFGWQTFTVPTKMELADMKHRQSRSSPKSLDLLHKSNSISSHSKLDKGLSHVLRSLSCRSSHFLNVID